MDEPVFTSWILSLAYSPRRNVLLAGFRDGTAVQLDARTLERRATFQPATPQGSVFASARSAVTTCAFTPDGDTAACGTENGPLFLLDRNLRPFWSDRVDLSFAGAFTFTGFEEMGLALPAGGEPDMVGGCAFAPDGRTGLIARTQDLTLIRRRRKWRVRSRVKTAYPITALSYSPGGLLLAVGEASGSVELRDGTGATTIRRLGQHAGPVSCCSWSPNGDVLATGSFDQELRIWRLTAGSVEVIRIPQRARANDCAFTRDGRFLATVTGWGSNRVSADGYEFAMYPTSGGKAVLTMPFPHPPIAVCALDESNTVAIGVGKTICKVTAAHL